MYSTHKKLNAVGGMHHHMNHDSNGEHQSDAMLHIHMEGNHLQIDSSMFSEPLPPQLPEPVIESYDLIEDIEKGFKKIKRLFTS